MTNETVMNGLQDALERWTRTPGPLNKAAQLPYQRWPDDWAAAVLEGCAADAGALKASIEKQQSVERKGRR